MTSATARNLAKLKRLKELRLRAAEARHAAAGRAVRSCLAMEMDRQAGLEASIEGVDRTNRDRLKAIFSHPDDQALQNALAASAYALTRMEIDQAGQALDAARGATREARLRLKQEQERLAHRMRDLEKLQAVQTELDRQSAETASRTG